MVEITARPAAISASPTGPTGRTPKRWTSSGTRGATRTITRAIGARVANKVRRCIREVGGRKTIRMDRVTMKPRLRPG